jgi:hypothetical protein
VTALPPSPTLHSAMLHNARAHHGAARDKAKQRNLSNLWPTEMLPS